MSDELLRAGAQRQKKLLMRIQREQHDRILRETRRPRQNDDDAAAAFKCVFPLDHNRHRHRHDRHLSQSSQKHQDQQHAGSPQPRLPLLATSPSPLFTT